ncbi:MAG: pantetheine-phosphate adenylyltransferase [Clostridiales bacterium]|nr:pantetheine-phosphate adenylyltransferase [Clostridiales bacterium]
MKAIIAGSFNPFTLGHKDIVTRVASMFDEVVVAVADDTYKKTAPLSVRTEIAKLSLSDVKGVRVLPFSGLLTDFAKKTGAEVIVRGLRNTVDFEYEKSLGEAYKSLSGIETLFLMCSPELSHVSSSLVRSLAELNAPMDGYVAVGAQSAVKAAYAKKDKE